VQPAPLCSPSASSRTDGPKDDRLREAVGETLKILLVRGEYGRPTTTRGEDNVCVDDVVGISPGQQRTYLMRFFTVETDYVAAA